MPRSLLRGLTAKIGALEREHADLLHEQDVLEIKIAGVRNNLTLYRGVYKAEGGEPLPVLESDQRDSMTISEAAVTILSEAGEPLRASEIARTIVQRRLAKISEKNPVSVLISIMRRKPEIFDALGDGMYVLRIK